MTPPGRWWHKGEEIDIVALNEEWEDILFFECKWSKLNERDAFKILTDLKRKAALVQWHDSARKEHYDYSDWIDRITGLPIKSYPVDPVNPVR